MWWIVTSFRPINMVEDHGIKSVLKLLNPRFHLVTISHVIRIILWVNGEITTSLKVRLFEVPFVSLTAEFWSDEQCIQILR